MTVTGSIQIPPNNAITVDKVSWWTSGFGGLVATGTGIRIVAS